MITITTSIMSTIRIALSGPDLSRRKEMTDVEKGAIIVLFHLQYSLAIISKIIGRQWSTIKNFVIRQAQRNTIGNAVRSGQP